MMNRTNSIVASIGAMLLLTGAVMAQTPSAQAEAIQTETVVARADATILRLENVKRIPPTESGLTDERWTATIQHDRSAREPVEPWVRNKNKSYPFVETNTILDRGDANFDRDAGYEPGARAVFAISHVVDLPSKQNAPDTTLWRWEVPNEYQKGGFASGGNQEHFLNQEKRHAYALGARNQDPILLLFALEKGLLWQQKLHFSSDDDTKDLHPNFGNGGFYATLDGGLILVLYHEPKDNNVLSYSEVWVYNSIGRRTNRYRFPQVEGLALKRAGRGEAFLLLGGYRVNNPPGADGKPSTGYTEKDVVFLLDARGELGGAFADAKGSLVNVQYQEDTAYAALDYREKEKRTGDEKNVLYRLF